MGKYVDKYLEGKISNGMKIKSSVKKICAKCKMVKRGKHLRIICSNPKHKQKQ